VSRFAALLDLDAREPTAVLVRAAVLDHLGK
jgi:hypothetical protein